MHRASGLADQQEPAADPTGSTAAAASVPSAAPAQVAVSQGVPTSTPPVTPPHFGAHRMRGQVYDLSHLNPFSFEVAGTDRSYTVEVRFGCHCFTEELQQHHAPDLRYTHSGETRAFCTIRHQLSAELPRLFRTLSTQSVYNNRGGNFFFWRRQTVTGQNEPYLIFFDAVRVTQKPGVHVLIEVNSAHLKPNMALFASPVKFNTLVEAKANGRKLKVGPAQHIKRK